MRSEHDFGTLDQIGRRDHSLTSEYRIFGPPGTGKTASLALQIRTAADKYGPDGVLVTSYSRAAAAELVGRDLPVLSERIGTLHSHCWHALGGPKLAEAHVHDWNRDNPHLAIPTINKQTKLSGEGSTEEEGDDSPRRGDLLLQELNRLRNKLVNPEAWPAAVRNFAVQWTHYKNSRALVDFCDLIENCLRDVAAAPRMPAAIFADEAQDLNPMQLKLIRKWGRRAEYFVFAMDDDQTIYSFAGAAPEAILDAPVPDDHIIILKQSYRVPRAIHRVAEQLIHRVSRRQEKIYLPRPDAGSVNRLANGYKSPEYAILSSAVKHLEQGKTVMFLASCSYMLRPLINVLRKNALPFHNPYRQSNGFWNPLRLGKGSSASRVLALLDSSFGEGDGNLRWSGSNFKLWVESLGKEGILKANAAQFLLSIRAKQAVPQEYLREVFEDRALESLLFACTGDHRNLLTWWRARLSADVRNRIQFPADIAARYGSRALTEIPRITVGTIHSVKGGAADVVYLFPDLSRAGDAQYQRAGPPCDSVIRLFYVGATRARETLYICDRENSTAIVM